jgi:hypothetical protein
MDRTGCDCPRPHAPQPIGEILDELLAQYEAKFPGVYITVVETAA